MDSDDDSDVIFEGFGITSNKRPATATHQRFSSSSGSSCDLNEELDPADNDDGLEQTFLLDTSVSPMQSKETTGQEEDEEPSNTADVGRHRRDVDDNRTRSAAMLTNVLTNAPIMPTDESKTNENASKLRRRTIQCFNCDGEHILSKCKLPLDRARIRENQERHRSQRPVDNGRYHVGTSFKPGHISESLRNALALRSNELPEWIYRMRAIGYVDGYPPGYLKDAIVGARSNDNDLLDFYSDDSETTGKKLSDKSPQSSHPIRIDANRIIYYYGFNVQSRHGTKDRDNGRFRIASMERFITELESKLKKDKSHHHRQEPDSLLPPPPPPPPTLDGYSTMTNDELEQLLELKKREMADMHELKSAKPIRASTSAIKRTISSRSLDITVGTPLSAGPCAKRAKPSLDNFADGIIPFKAKEEETGKHRGFFQRVMKKIMAKLGQ